MIEQNVGYAVISYILNAPDTVMFLPVGTNNNL